jgi:hypothetical protein
MKPVIYMHLDYEDYKSLERQMREVKETSHTTQTGFYHKSVRISLSGITIEFHGPNVGGYGHQEDR